MTAEPTALESTLAARVAELERQLAVKTAEVRSLNLRVTELAKRLRAYEVEEK